MTTWMCFNAIKKRLKYQILCCVYFTIIITKTAAWAFGFKRTISFNKYLRSVNVCETRCWALDTDLFIELRVDWGEGQTWNGPEGKSTIQGAPGWLVRLSVRLRLRSWSHGPGVRAPCRALCWPLIVWSLFRILCLPLSLPLPCSCSVSLRLKNK